MSDVTSNPFNLPINAYAAFDAVTLKGLMQNRLTQGGVYTDQIYEGSNFNSLLDIIAYSYNVLLFYLNKTASESLFSQTQIYENMNKIVKILGYNPIGYQTAVLPFSAVAPSTISQGIYTIPRYSYFTVNGINYTFTTDVAFTKTTDLNETLKTLMNASLLYQGSITEFPIYIATGEPLEEFSIVTVDANGQNEIIDHNSIHVYVKDRTNKWAEWNRVTSLFTEGPDNLSFECRLNENQRYTLKFGDGVNGRQLLTGDLVAIFYLKSNGASGEIGQNVLDNNTLFLYNSLRFNEIFTDIKNANTTYINSDQASQIVFTNPSKSTAFSNLESVTDIRTNAVNFYKSQNRLITTKDFENYIKANFSNIINDVKVVNNWEYLAEHVRYLYNIGLKSPNLDSRVLFNQVNFADSCDFNNIYVYVVPKFKSENSYKIVNNFLPIGLKDNIVNSLQNIKLATSEIIPMDAVYTAFGIGIASNAEISTGKITPSMIDETKLIVYRQSSSNFSESQIKNQVANIISEYFNIDSCELGQNISLTNLTSKILSIDGVSSLKTLRISDGIEIYTNGISFIAFNPIYSDPGEDIQLVLQDLNLPYFKFPYLYNAENVINNIEVKTASTQGASPREY